MSNDDIAGLAPLGAGPWGSQGASLSLHLGIMAILAFVVPPPPADGETGVEDVEWIRHVLASSGTGADDASFGDRASDGDPPPGEHSPGATGTDAPAKTGAPSRGAADRIRPVERRADVRQQAGTFGMIGLLADPASVDVGAPSPWTRDATNGASPGEELGSMWGDALGDSFGIGGVGLSGIGEGGGGRGEGIDIGEVGTMGRGRGSSEGFGTGFACGCGSGARSASHRTRAPVLRCGPPPGAERDRGAGCTSTVSGRLPPEAVQRVVRQSFGRFRLCYEDGLRRDPGLAGRVSVEFVIDRQGAVSMASNEGSDLGDESVVACVVRGFQALSFPEPEGGIVTVVYPLVLSPD
jgi:hypothetical protein